MRPHFALFDALRGLAVVAVVTFHVASITGQLGHGPAGRVSEVLGGQAVILFFAISGFLLYRPYVAARAESRGLPSTRRYARNRVLRIVPAYWVALTLLAIYPAITGVFTSDFWRYYGFTQLYSLDTFNRGIPVAWTLCVEVTFYLLLPVWAIGIRRVWRGSWVHGEYLVLALVAAGGVFVQVLGARREVSALFADSLPGQMPWLAIGMALAVASVTGAPRLSAFVTRRSGLCWLGALAALGGLAALAPGGGILGLVAALSTPQPTGRALARVALSALLCTCAILPAVFGEDAGGLPRRVLRLAPVAWLGTVSFSLYLYHLTIAELIGLSSDPFHFSAQGFGLTEKVHQAVTPLLLVLTLAASAAVAALSYRFIEAPFLRRKGARATAPAPAAPGGGSG